MAMNDIFITIVTILIALPNQTEKNILKLKATFKVKDVNKK